jgi:hypothetical protein
MPGAIVDWICHESTAGVGSTFPAASVARTLTVWGPTERLEYEDGEVHRLHEPLSILHSKLLGSEAANATVALRAVVVPAGPEVIHVSGAVVSGGVVTGGVLTPPGLFGSSGSLPLATSAPSL